MDSKEFSKIRHNLERTQKQLARLLCVSPKAIQSFEQGWRNVPNHIEREMLLLLSLKRSLNMDEPSNPCWEIKNCTENWRENCIVWEYRVRHFCWLINGTFCQGRFQVSWESKIKICRQCEIFYLLPLND